MPESATNPVNDFFVLLKEFSLSPDYSEQWSRYGSNKSDNVCLRKEGEFLFLIIMRRRRRNSRRWRKNCFYVWHKQRFNDQCGISVVYGADIEIEEEANLYARRKWELCTRGDLSCKWASIDGNNCVDLRNDIEAPDFYAQIDRRRGK